ncbi:MAG: carbohydrate ABC transporter permease [Acidobacteriota bacterium]
MKRIGLYMGLIVGAILFLYPFLWMVSATIKPEMEIGGFHLIPEQLSWENYRLVFTKIPIGRAFFNSIFVSTTATAFAILFGAVVGYALSRLFFPGRDLIFNLILFTLMIPAPLTLIPLYTLIVRLGWVDTYQALIVPAMVSGFGILLFRQFFRTIPQSLIEAARLDGCTEWQILFRIVLPLSKPVVTTVGILTFMGIWNDLLWPLLVIHDQQLMTMPQMVALFSIGGLAEARLGLQLAAATLLALPVIIAYTVFQRQFIQSMASSGLKG